jgi:GT2 family glycosyltransferase
LVLATIGRTTEVERLFDTLLAQTDKHFELIVVDQNADNRLVEAVTVAAQRGLAVQHLRMDRPSLAGARNLGIAKAHGQLIAFPDDDCWYEPDVVEQVRNAFAAHGDWGGAVAQWVEQAQALRAAPSDEALSAREWRAFKADGASSISLFFRAETLRRLGGFDERLGVGQWFGAGEETDLILRALGAGVVIGRCTAARVHHHFASGIQHQAGANWRAAMRRGRGTGALFVKHSVSWRVFVRGFLAPPVKAAMQGQGLKGVGIGLALSTGRVQGALKWLLTER